MKSSIWAFLTNKWVMIAIGVLILFGFAYAFAKAKLSTKQMKYPNNGAGIPAGWSPTPAANQLYTAMNGLGTDEGAIWSALDPLTPDQRAAVYNEFNNLYQQSSGADLFQWFDGDLSGSDLSRALAYFN